jgi:conjugal transfer pilus assembly protein TraW
MAVSLDGGVVMVARSMHRLNQVLSALATLALPFATSTAALAGTSTIGRTWPIAEPDALSEIEGQAARVPDMTKAFGPRERWSAMKAAALGVAHADRSRTVVPFYTLDQDIRLPEGKLLYAKGYSFNPLAYVSLPQRLIVVHPRELDWALRTARPADFILLASGSPGDADAITLGERHGRALFLLEERVKARLGLTVAPVIVAQHGQKLVLTEVDVVEVYGAKAARKAPQ